MTLPMFNSARYLGICVLLPEPNEDAIIHLIHNG